MIHAPWISYLVCALSSQNIYIYSYSPGKLILFYALNTVNRGLWHCFIFKKCYFINMKQLTRIYSRENRFNVNNNMENKYEWPFFFLCNRSITKMDKETGSKIPFMSEHPEFGRLDTLDIYADEHRDGN